MRPIVFRTAMALILLCTAHPSSGGGDKPRPAPVKAVSAQPAEPAPSASSSSTELSLSDLKSVGTAQHRKGERSRKKSTAARKKTERPAPSAAAPVAADRKLFDTAAEAYRQGNYRGALELYDRLLADHAASPLAADAALHKADCYLKLSAQ